MSEIAAVEPSQSAPRARDSKTRRQPEQQAPPVQRLRLRYTKLGTARFASHRDFTRAFERALRRASIPMAYSSGFNPHPRISYANAAPTGAESEAEYLEIGLAEVCDPVKVRLALDEALPPGMGVVEAVVAVGEGLPERLTASAWDVRVIGAEADSLKTALAALLSADSVEIGRMTKKGMRRFDARVALVAGSVVTEPAGEPCLRLLLHQTIPLVRPDDIVAALRQIAPEVTAGWGSLLLRRLAQGPLLPDADVSIGTPEAYRAALGNPLG